MKKGMRFCVLLLTAATLLCGCSDMDVTGLVAPDAPTTVPTVTASAKYQPPPEDPNLLGNLVLDAYTAQEITLRITDADLAGRLLSAMNDTEGFFESNARYPMDNTFVIRDADDQEIARITLSSDGDPVGRNEADGQYFRVPEWVYYQIEYYLWTRFSSLCATPLTWDPSQGNGALTLRLDTMLRTVLTKSYGYADAYLTAYKLYGVNQGDYQVKVYLLVDYAGYVREGDCFRQSFHRITPVALTLYRMKNNTWRYIAYQEPKDSDGTAGLSQSEIRAVLPYDYTVEALADLADPGNLPADLTAKVQDWLRDRGLGGLTVVE